jgi:hypothetical protein
MFWDLEQIYSMKQIHKVECPTCNSEFDTINGIEDHIIARHCKFCGRKKPVEGDPLKPVQILETPEYDTVFQRIKDNLLDNRHQNKIDDIQGGFTPVLINKLIEEAEEYVEFEGTLTEREILEYHNLHKNRSSGKICSTCLEEYEKIVNEVSED